MSTKLRIRGVAVSAAAASVAIAVSAAGAGSALAAKPSKFIEFNSPSGNIHCGIGATYARCDITHRTYTPPVHHCVEGDYGNSFGVGASGQGVLLCVSDAVAGPGFPALAYGQSRTLGPITCSSAITGMTCRNTRDGHGFFVSIQSYRLF